MVKIDEYKNIYTLCKNNSNIKVGVIKLVHSKIGRHYLMAY